MARATNEIPDDPADLLRALEDTAQEQRALTARLEQLKAHRNDLIATVRARRLLTWREIAALFGMTETALQMASRPQRSHPVAGETAGQASRGTQ